MMKRYILAVVFTALFVSCSSYKKRNSDADTPKDKIANVFWVKDDSLLTDKEKELRDKIFVILRENVAIKNNRFSMNLSKRDFLSRGIPEEYYHLLIKNIDDNNKFMEDHGVEDMESLWKDALKEFGKPDQ